MLELLNTADQALFILLNLRLANPVTDLLMPVITNDYFLRIGYLLALAAILWRGNRLLRWLVLFSAVTLLLTDQISSNLLKGLIERPRPCHLLDEINLLVGCGGGFSMPSSHAANAFGQAALFAAAVRSTRWALYTVAALVALSRVFVGVHYPGDILLGAALGCLLGWLVYAGYARILLTRPTGPITSTSKNDNQGERS